MDKKTALIKLIKNSDLLTNEAKIRLIERVEFLTDEEVDTLGTILAAQIQYSQSRRYSIVKEILLLLKKLEDKIIA